jgi:putative ATP-dependent endonuclease of OLD family
MKIAYVDIKNFRGISNARVFFNDHTVLIGDNNAGKSTIFEAIDLVLGPDRVHRTPVIDEHDFYNGQYFVEKGDSPRIIIEAVVIDLAGDQQRRFKNNLEFWDTEKQIVLEQNTIADVDKQSIKEALRVKFVGYYDSEDDDFKGDTFFCSPVRESNDLARFTKTDKRECGFLYLRAIRTGMRALSMERGSLLDIILKIREVRPKMWENVLTQLRNTDVATDPTAGIKEILVGVQSALKEFVPSDWGTEPHLRVSDLTRENLRKTLTIFMSTGENSYSAPFHHQGTGTINTMVLALLSMIAESKMNVIFAMEEPEIAIPPYAQKRIINNIRSKSAQAIFTSHSPFVLEEFPPSQIVLIQRDKNGVVDSKSVQFPAMIKPKSYNSEFRLRFSEALLAKRILLTEGATEATAYPAAARKLNELSPEKYASLEALGVAIFDAKSESNIAPLGEYFKHLGKTVFAVFDKQKPEELALITKAVQFAYESSHKGIENLLLHETPIEIIKQFYESIDSWPSHLTKPDTTKDDSIKEAIKSYLMWGKGDKFSSELIELCNKVDHVPATLTKALGKIKEELERKPIKNEQKPANV